MCSNLWAFFPLWAYHTVVRQSFKYFHFRKVSLYLRCCPIQHFSIAYSTLSCIGSLKCKICSRRHISSTAAASVKWPFTSSAPNHFDFCFFFSFLEQQLATTVFSVVVASQEIHFIKSQRGRGKKNTLQCQRLLTQFTPNPQEEAKLFTLLYDSQGERQKKLRWKRM